MEDALKTSLRRQAESLSVVPAPSVFPWDHPARERHLLDYLVILRKHQWLILTFLLTVVTVATIATVKQKPMYQASGSVEIDKETQNQMQLPNEMTDWDEYMDTEDYIETQTKILQSETLALQTIRTLDLGRYPEFGGTGRTAAFTGKSGTQRPAILGAFLSRLSVKRVPNSRLIEVGFVAHDPQLAARVVNAHLQNFIEGNFRSKYDATTQASTWLSAELEELRMKVEKSENERLAYERQNQIWQVDEKQNITTQKLADLSNAVTAAQTDLATKQALYRMAASSDIGALPAIRDNPLVQDLLRRKSDLKQQYTTALSQFGPNYPTVQHIAAQQREVEQNLVTARKSAVESIKDDYETAREHVAILQQALDQQKTEANAMAEKLVNYQMLQHDAEANKQLYDGLLQKLKEADIAAGLRSSNIRIVDPALTPTTPAGPEKARNIALSLIIGLLGGIGLAVFREYLDNTVKSPDEIESLTGLPLLAVVPSLPSSNGHHRRIVRLARDAAPASADPPKVELLSYAQPKSQISESFRGLRTSLLLSQAEHPPQVILVTSALPREGKTTAAANLGVTLAQLGDRTLLLDSDLRKPGIRRALNLPAGNEVGLSSYLAGVCTLDEVIVSHPTIKNLSALTTGPVPPSPADLLSSHRMRDGIAELRRRFKFIVIDSPPVMAATDAVILSALTDGVLLVVRSGETPKEAFTRSRDVLASVKCRMLGVVLNAVNAGAPDYYYSYRYYPYAYGYGYGEETSDRPVEAGGNNAAMS
ncbi:MAG TPA: polysaccharide biosynthesis tyrosine autokinase [Candidatus Acidoferrales bacterium]|nr:polysaccharide biosynthesis tyrosine autokinase [Candidatus Acidoferrales bacterium]